MMWFIMSTVFRVTANALSSMDEILFMSHVGGLLLMAVNGGRLREQASGSRCHFFGQC